MLLHVTKVRMIVTSKKYRYNRKGSNKVCKLEAVYLKKLILAYYKMACFLPSFDSYRSLSLEIVNRSFFYLRQCPLKFWFLNDKNFII